MVNNITLPTEMNVTDGKGLFDWVQSVSNGSFFPSMTLGLFVVLFMLFRAGTTNPKAFVGSSFICMIISILLTTLGWMSVSMMYVSILITAIGAIWAYLEDRE